MIDENDSVIKNSSIPSCSSKKKRNRSHYRCSQSYTNSSNDTDLEVDEKMVASGFPRLKTKFNMKVGSTGFCILCKLDPTVILETVKVSYDLLEGIIVIGYQRELTVKNLDSIPIKLSDEENQTEEGDYELKTYIKHTYKVNIDVYNLVGSQVRQKENIIYVTVPRRNNHVG